jgi:hypothetical protein
MDPQRRKVDTHVEMDAWNRYAFVLISILNSSVISRISSALSAMTQAQLDIICNCLSDDLSKCVLRQQHRFFCDTYPRPLPPLNSHRYKPSSLHTLFSRCCIARLELSGAQRVLAIPNLISAVSQANAELFAQMDSSTPACISHNPDIVSLHWPLHRLFSIAFAIRMHVYCHNKVTMMLQLNAFYGNFTKQLFLTACTYSCYTVTCSNCCH